MKVYSTEFPGLFILEPQIFQDKRGFFVETYNAKVFVKLGLNYTFVQDNHAFSKIKGVLRGLHYQIPPMAQAKLVRVARGRVFDVVLDLRKGSPTFGKTFSIELSAEEGKQLLIPRGFAHGYLVLEDNTDFIYKVDNFYSKEHERGVYYDDPQLNINWPMKDVILSEKDKKQPFFNDLEIVFDF
ncbi:dTDP-4-dehydrorhamnose 3,5-epimerase [Desulfonauticus submarinus]|uniref:dTDP-4-dehydrorhamnose 3,5-epimerase n=1 Tax=Desulfonauticus submarinus TaxID=206665 RepID=A0A1H0DM84_9BACT|nr:dTDP-4-dehydrorhamnose 3,5-epimerase [Desulfonauticus submarinus]SDN71169.1 dTDP-4-dehydrorhamnose 3,5-epimerase [Desulfonauticus submarinus]